MTFTDDVRKNILFKKLIHQMFKALYATDHAMGNSTGSDSSQVSARDALWFA